MQLVKIEYTKGGNEIIRSKLHTNSKNGRYKWGRWVIYKRRIFPRRS